jgi:DNA-binding transcriptional MerR regulator
LPSKKNGQTDIPDAMTISQLAARSGVPPRRLRYYVAERLIPPPVGRGRAAYYTHEHLGRLEQIRALREVNLSLDEIRDRLRESPAGVAPPPSPPTTEEWRRWKIVSGVEIHVRQDLDSSLMSKARMLVGVAYHIFSDPNAPMKIEGAIEDR